MSEYDFYNYDAAAAMSKPVENEEFLNKLSYYKSVDGVSVDPQIESIYSRKAAIVRNANLTLKSSASSTKSYSERLDDAQERFTEDSRQLHDMRRKISEAKSEYKKTLIFSKEAKQAKHKLDDLKHQFKNKNRQRHKTKQKIEEYKQKISEKKHENHEAQQKKVEAEEYMKKLVTGIEKQFDTADKMLAILDLVKTKQLDMNDPNLSLEAKSAIINFSNMASKGLKISITEPLNQLGSADLMKAYEEIQKVIAQKDDIQKAVDDRVSKRVENRDKYIKLLGKDPDLSQLEEEKSR